MKLIISTIIVGIVLFALGGLFYGLLFSNFFKTYYAGMTRGDADMKIWAYAAGSLVQAFFLYLIYSKGYQGGSPVVEGFKFGILISLFYGIPFALFEWAGMAVKYQAVAVDAGLGIVMLIIASVLTAVIHGRTVKPAASA